MNLANELLPPLPEDQDDPSRSEISSREELLINQPMLLQNFGLILPSIIQVNFVDDCDMKKLLILFIVCENFLISHHADM